MTSINQVNEKLEDTIHSVSSLMRWCEQQKEAALNQEKPEPVTALRISALEDKWTALHQVRIGLRKCQAHLKHV